MMLFIVLLISFYILVLFKLRSGLCRLKPGKNVTFFTVSIIVAARNEEDNIQNCLQALVNQDYPVDKFEIIIIDDRSTDNTANLVKEYNESNSNITLILVKELAAGMAPKKQALKLGIERAKGDILIFTDADCVPSANWVRCMVSHFTPDVGLVAGFSPLDRTKRQTIFARLIRLDSLALAAVAAGSFGIKFPLTCNGRNLAYRRSLFYQVNGFAEIGHLISGDDDLFLHRVRKNTDWQVRYAIEEEAAVSSIAPSSVNQFFHQRVRHASKGRHYPSDLMLGLIAVYLLNFSILALLLCSFWHVKFLLIGISFFLIKAIFEFVFLFQAAKIFQRMNYLSYFPLAMLLHIPYVVLFGLWGQVGKFTWKGYPFNSELNSTNKGQKD